MTVPNFPWALTIKPVDHNEVGDSVEMNGNQKKDEGAANEAGYALPNT